jgi:hypothetical protein
VTLASGQADPWSLAVNATGAYWSEGSETGVDFVMSVPLVGGTLATVAIAQNGAGNLALDASSIYWTTSDGAVVKNALGGGTPTTLASGQVGGALAVCATAVFLDADYNCGDGCDNAAILQIPIDGGAVMTLATAPTISEGMAVDATSVYWSDGSIERVDIHPSDVRNDPPAEPGHSKDWSRQP